MHMEMRLGSKNISLMILNPGNSFIDRKFMQ
jgi:hypothetical protein